MKQNARNGKKKGWSFDERDVLQDVKAGLPNDWQLRVFLVTSGDTGKEYWVQLLQQRDHGTQTIGLCDCPVGKFRAPLVILGSEADHCKHVKMLLRCLPELEGGGE